MPLDECPAIQRDQLRTAERRPTGEGLITPPVGLDRGRRATSTPPGPVRAACRELTSNPQRQRSLLGTLGRANHPYSQTRARGGAPRFLWLEILEKPENHSIVAHSKPLA